MGKKKTLFLKKTNKKDFHTKYQQNLLHLHTTQKCLKERKDQTKIYICIFMISWQKQKHMNLHLCIHLTKYWNEKPRHLFLYVTKKMTHESTKIVLGTYLVTLIFHAFSEVGCFAMLTSKLSTRSLSYEPKFILWKK